MELDEYFMNEALKMAKTAYEENEVPIGALIVGNNQILAKTYNQTEKLKDATAHAEMLAITAACESLASKYLHHCTLYVTLEPCPMCSAALSWAQISKIVFAAPDTKKGYRIFSPLLLHPKTIVKAGIMEEECGGLISDFFKKRRE